MPCYDPLQAVVFERPGLKKRVVISSELRGWFRMGKEKPNFTPAGKVMPLPCSICLGCRLEKARQWAVRCVHEASLYEDNSFITLTFAPEELPEGGSLSRSHMQAFMKDLRREYDDRRIRAFYCGEYGSKLGRPHYHAAIFNLSFDDREYWKTVGDYKYYTSGTLAKLWPYGFNVIGDLTFESAAYVARYVTKKVNGYRKDDHYGGKYPEFSQASLRPGIGYDWFARFGMSDVFPLDEIVVNGSKSKPPRYYDKLLERCDPDMFAAVKLRRELLTLSKKDEYSFDRLQVKLKCQQARMSSLSRMLEI